MGHLVPEEHGEVGGARLHVPGVHDDAVAGLLDRSDVAVEPVGHLVQDRELEAVELDVLLAGRREVRLERGLVAGHVDDDGPKVGLRPHPVDPGDASSACWASAGSFLASCFAPITRAWGVRATAIVETSHGSGQSVPGRSDTSSSAAMRQASPWLTKVRAIARGTGARSKPLSR